MLPYELTSTYFDSDLPGEGKRRYGYGRDKRPDCYQLSRKLRSVFELQYRKKDSTRDIDEYSEMSAFASLVYGFGQVSRANQGGGY